MNANLEFRIVTSRLGKMRFSTQREVQLACQKPGAAQIAKTPVLASSSNRMVMFNTRSLPLDLYALFNKASLLQLEEMGSNGTSFIHDLQNYCKSVGFAPFLRHDDFHRPFSACNLLIGGASRVYLPCNFQIGGTKESCSAFFGEDYNWIEGRSIMVSLADPMPELGILSISMFIAYELGCVKLAEQAASCGLNASHISKNEEIFFASAYAYNFARCLLLGQGMTSLDNAGAVSLQLRRAAPDLTNVALNYSQFFMNMESSFGPLANAIKRRYLIEAPKGQVREFGAPSSVNLINSQTTIYQEIKEQKQGKEYKH